MSTFQSHRLQRIETALLVAALAALSSSALAQATISVEAGKPGHPVSPLLWGIFFEDINLSADGGLYPELVRNRSFEDSREPEYWTLANAAGGSSEMAVEASRPLNTLNPHCLRVNVNGPFTLQNDGYWGMNIVQGDAYTLKLATRAADGFEGPLKVKLAGSTGTELAAGAISGLTGAWKYYTLDLVASAGDPKANLQISASGRGRLFLDMVSLLPKKTWKQHGLRADLAEALDALHPSFMRFPGGNWIEGDDLAHMYNWKTTIGDVDARTPLWNTWGYNTTQGLGFHEYLQLCEDLGAQSLFDINDGMSLQDSVPLSRMGQWTQDALDAIEYANGPANSVWGALRAKAGHPAPFNLRYMEIGNENGGPDYHQRWALLVNAIRQKYPDMQLIVNTDLRGRPYPRNPKPDIVDEHYYESPESFMRRADQYDSYDRKGPKIFIGEYAVTRNAGRGNLRAAVGEAAFMTGMERNSDVVLMASYAPLFVNLNHRAWNPDLINFDSSRWYGLPGYYVQLMFSQNRGDLTLPITVVSGDVAETPAAGCIGVGTWNTQAEFKDIKVTAPDGNVLFTSDFSRNSDGWKFLGDGQWKVQDGALRQTAERESVRALAGDKSWKDCTLELKARKIAGREGFLVLFHINDDEDRFWWNLGGWNNTQDALELDETLDGKPESIDAGRWYDIRLQLNGDRIQCWLDGKLIHDLRRPRQITRRLYASATHDSKSGDIILKVVNGASDPLSADINLRGANNLSGSGRAIVLTSASPKDENSLEHPDKVSPKTEDFQFQGSSLRRVFPGNSVTVLRFGKG
jgi:alpha-L-arabinofuranosidase